MLYSFSVGSGWGSQFPFRQYCLKLDLDIPALISCLDPDAKSIHTPVNAAGARPEMVAK
jgi:hypothetical protein